MKYLWLVAAAVLLLSACDNNRPVEKIVIPTSPNVSSKETFRSQQEEIQDRQSRETPEEIVSDIVPEISISSLEPVAKGTMAEGKYVHDSPILAGTITGDFTTYPRVLLQFDLDANDALIVKKKCAPDASLIIDDPKNKREFQLDPNNPPVVLSEESFPNTSGWKVIGYRILPIDEEGQILTDDEGRMLASKWKTVGFMLNNFSAGSVRIVYANLRIDSGELNDEVTECPEVRFRVHGNFSESTAYRLDFSYLFKGKVQTDHLDVAKIGDLVFDPTVNNPELAETTAKINLTYRLISSDDGGNKWTEVSKANLMFEHVGVEKAEVSEVAEDLGGRPYRGGVRLVTGELTNAFVRSGNLYHVEVETGSTNKSGKLEYRRDGDAEVRFDQKEQQYRFHHVITLGESVERVRVRVKQRTRGKKYFSSWVETSVTPPKPLELGVVALLEDEKPRGRREDARGPGLAPEIVGRLDGAPSVEELEDNSKRLNPFDYREFSLVRIEFFNGETPPDEADETDEYSRTNAFGYFRFRPKTLKLGRNTVWVRAVLKLDNGRKYYGVPRSVEIKVESPEFPRLSIRLRDPDAEKKTEEGAQRTYWSTLDPKVIATLSTTRTSLLTRQVAIQFAVDLPGVAGDESDVVGRALAGLGDQATYLPLLLGHEGEIVKVRARLAYLHPQLRENVFSDWEELNVQLQTPVHESSKIASLEVLGSDEKNDQEQVVIRGTSARIAGSVTYGKTSSGIVSVQFQDASNGKVLGKINTSRNGRFSHKLKDLTVGTLNVEAVVLDWNYQTAAIEPGPSTGVAIDVQPVIPIDVRSLELHSDTGVSMEDGITVNPTLIGQVAGTGRLSSTRVSLDYGDGLEAIVAVDARGRFLHRSKDLKKGNGYTVKSRVATWDKTKGGYTYGEAKEITFQLEAGEKIRAKLGKVELADTSVDNWDQDTGIVHDITLQGRVNVAERLDGIIVHVDFDGDGEVDDSMRSDRRGEFTFSPTRLDAGPINPQVRTLELGYEAGPWVSAGAFNYQPKK